MTDRAEFEAWIKTTEGHPFAGKFADLMWLAWQAAIKQERQACAKECDEMPQRLGIHCARAIRARSEDREGS